MPQTPSLTVGPREFQLVSGESGPVNYYSVTTEGGTTFLRARYLPPMKTSVVGWKMPDDSVGRIGKVRWSWRARTLPAGGDECIPGKGDSAAVVYLTFRRTLRYYTLKYVWSSTGVRGSICDSKRNPFVAQDTVILESGGPLGVWKTEEVDLASEFRKHFEGGDPAADVPGLVGIGLMSDGDQTSSESSADYGPFTLSR